MNQVKSICKLCGEPLTINSTELAKKKYEEKWNVHWACRDLAYNILDRSVGIKTTRNNDPIKQGKVANQRG